MLQYAIRRREAEPDPASPPPRGFRALAAFGAPAAESQLQVRVAAAGPQRDLTGGELAAQRGAALGDQRRGGVDQTENLAIDRAGIPIFPSR